MESLLETDIQCPYCGERIGLLVDTSAGAQAYVEDCSVCCRPIEVRVVPGEDGPQVEVSRDDD